MRDVHNHLSNCFNCSCSPGNLSAGLWLRQDSSSFKDEERHQVKPDIDRFVHGYWRSLVCTPIDRPIFLELRVCSSVYLFTADKPYAVLLLHARKEKEINRPYFSWPFIHHSSLCFALFWHVMPRVACFRKVVVAKISSGPVQDRPGAHPRALIACPA